MRLLDGDDLAGLALPVRGKGLVEGDVELARGVVADVEQRHGRGLRERRRAGGGQGGGGQRAQGGAAAKGHGETPADQSC